MKITKLILLFTVLFMSIWNCSKKSSNEVIVYTTVDQIFSVPVLKYFEKQTGIRVKALFDIEETKSTGVLNRLIAEKNNPQCDVFWSGDPVRAIILKTKGSPLHTIRQQLLTLTIILRIKSFTGLGVRRGQECSSTILTC